MAVKENKQDSPGWDDALRAARNQHVILRQSVTMLAYMDKSNRSSNRATPSSSFWDSIGVAHSRDLPILVGAATGALGLVVIILLSIIIWHCCTRNNTVDKAYGVENLSRTSSTSRQTPSGVVQSDSVVFHGAKPRRPAEPWAVDRGGGGDGAAKMTRSLSVPLKHSQEGCKIATAVPEREASYETPVPSILVEKDYGSGRSEPRPAPSSSEGYGTDDGGTCLPSAARTSESGARADSVTHRGLPCISQCSPYVRTVQYSRDNLDATLDESPYGRYACSELTLKTRSLPSWGRARQRPLSTEDDLGELYAKVNFSKRRKNRMRNDSAAAIAATKSRHPFRTLPFVHNDTDSLVDNEAVVVYDERTAV